MYFRCNNWFLLLVYTIHLSLSTNLVDPPPMRTIYMKHPLCKSAFKSQDDYIYKLLFYSDHDLYLDLDLKVKPDYDYGHYLVDLGLYPWPWPWPWLRTVWTSCLTLRRCRCSTTRCTRRRRCAASCTQPCSSSVHSAFSQ